VRGEISKFTDFPGAKSREEKLSDPRQRCVFPPVLRNIKLLQAFASGTTATLVIEVLEDPKNIFCV
jgi:hypothetical protein